MPVEDVLDPKKDHVEVDVLANDSDPDGSTNDLEVALDGSYEGVDLREDGTLKIVPQEEQQRIRYIITDQDDQSSAGYVWVPGTAKQAPVWVGEPVKVQAGSEGTVDLADPSNVRVRPGAHAQVTDPARFPLSTATVNWSGRIHPPIPTCADFSGNDTITVEVTDGAVGDPRRPPRRSRSGRPGGHEPPADPRARCSRSSRAARSTIVSPWALRTRGR